jgi:phage-related protein
MYQCCRLSLGNDYLSETCISRIATFRKHSLVTLPKCRAEKRVWVYKNFSVKNTPQTINEIENLRGYRLRTGNGIKQFATGGLNQDLGCTNLKLARAGSNEQTSTSYLGELVPNHASTRQCYMQKHT